MTYKSKPPLKIILLLNFVVKLMQQLLSSFNRLIIFNLEIYRKII